MKIVTFNVYWFQGSRFKGFPPPTPRSEIVDGIRTLLEPMSADVLCIQELQSTQAAAAWTQAWNARAWDYQCAQHPERPAYGGGIFCRSPGWRFMPIASPTLERYAAKAIREADGLCVANVHLRSDRFLPMDAASLKRREELQVALDTGPLPDVVAGDFNAQAHEDLCDLLRERDYFDAIARVGLGDAVTTVGTGQGDRIWVRRNLAGKFVGAGVMDRRQTLLDDGEHASDHLPIWAEMDL